jgi:hypothetical protein
LHIRFIRQIDRHPADSDEDCSPERISQTENLINWNEDMDNPIDNKDNCAADNE